MSAEKKTSVFSLSVVGCLSGVKIWDYASLTDPALVKTQIIYEG